MNCCSLNSGTSRACPSCLCHPTAAGNPAEQREPAGTIPSCPTCAAWNQLPAQGQEELHISAGSWENTAGLRGLWNPPAWHQPAIRLTLSNYETAGSLQVSFKVVFLYCWHVCLPDAFFDNHPAAGLHHWPLQHNKAFPFHNKKIQVSPSMPETWELLGGSSQSPKNYSLRKILSETNWTFLAIYEVSVPSLTSNSYCPAMGISQPKKPPHFSIPIPPKAAPTTITGPQSLLWTSIPMAHMEEVTKTCNNHLEVL